MTSDFGPLGANGTSLTVPVPPTGDQRIDGILGGVRWAGPVSYADPSSAADYEARHPESFSDFAQLSPEQLAAVHAALAGTGAADRGFSVAGLTNLAATYAGSGSAAEIRVANTSDPRTAYTYLPEEQPFGGDVFLGRSGRSPEPGNYHYMTVLHELGHALGLKHGNEDGSFGALPPEHDSMEFSLMTYRSFVGADTDTLHNGAGSYAQTYMIDDIAALQAMYGANFATNAGDTTYRWDPDTGTTRVDGAPAIVPGENRVFISVWDGGGIDTYDLSAYTSALDVDLTPGGHSTFSDDQRAWLGGGPNDGLARGNVFNARLYAGDPRSLIENAVGGSGDDRILGNVAANSLDGGPGADRMIGGPGDDRYFANDHGDRTIEMAGGGTDTVVTSVDGKLGRNLENLTLTGQAASATGNGLDNCLTGNGGSDTLRGRGGNDRLAGGFGPDVLIGGTGADAFCFADARESRRGATDTIRPGNGAPAFENAGPGAGDLIDLSAIDADPALPGNQDFILDQSRGPGHVWFLERHGDTVLRASAGSGGEMKLVIDDGAVPSLAYGAADFLGVA